MAGISKGKYFEGIIDKDKKVHWDEVKKKVTEKSTDILGTCFSFKFFAANVINRNQILR